MSDETLFTDDFLRQVTAAGEVDILVGVPTLNNHETIARVMSAIRVGFVKYFPRDRTALVNVDGGSTDGTPEIVKGTPVTDFRSYLASSPLRTMQTLTTTYGAMQGKGGALRVILAAAELLRAKACAIVSPDLESLTPEWIEALTRPIYREGFDFLAPIYQRHRFDGLLISHILSPLVAAAYGCEIEEPLGGEFAFSGQLASHFLSQDAWQQDFMLSVPEIWMVTTALVGGYRMCQAFLGPKVHSVNAANPDLAVTIQQVIGALFSCLEAHQSYWMTHEGNAAVPAFGFQYDLDLPPIRVNRKRMQNTFLKGVEELASILTPALTPETLQRIRDIAKIDCEGCRYADDLWVRTVYEFAGAFHRSVINRDHLLQALAPLYLGRINSFLAENHRASPEAARERIKKLRTQFESLKPYLAERWNAQT
ncbi:MAG: glycosyl transferase family 2 [Terriglobia bacterium]